MQKEYWVNVYEDGFKPNGQYLGFVSHSTLLEAKGSSALSLNKTLYRIHVKMKPAGVTYTTGLEMKVERPNWPVIKME
jgi:hypothetical protein